MAQRIPVEDATDEATVLAVAFLALFAATIAPILLLKYAPLDDFPNHLARDFIIASGGTNPILAKFYAVQWKLVPNLGMDLIVPWLAKVVGIYVAGKVFLVLILTLILAGVHAVHRAAFGRFSVGPLLAFLFVYNRMFQLGLTNYFLGVGLALWATAFWIALAQAPIIRRAATSLAFVAALYLCHLEALGLYGLAALSFEIQRIVSCPVRDIRFWRAEAVAFAAPFLVILVITHHAGLGSHSFDWATWSVSGKFAGVAAAVGTYDRLTDRAVAVLVAALALGAWMRGWLRLHPTDWVFLALTVGLTIALPGSFAGTTLLDVRLPIGALFILVGLCELRFPEPARIWCIRYTVFIAALALAHCALVEEVWRTVFAPMEAEIEASLQAIPFGSRVLVADLGEPGIAEPLEDMPCQAIIERSSLVACDFTTAEQPLSVRPPNQASVDRYGQNVPTFKMIASASEAPPPKPGDHAYWAGWPQNYDYLYVLFVKGAHNPMPETLEPAYVGTNFELFHIRSRRKSNSKGTSSNPQGYGHARGPHPEPQVP